MARGNGLSSGQIPAAPPALQFGEREDMLLRAGRTADQRTESPERLGRQPHPSGRESLRREHDLRRAWVRKGLGWGRWRGFIEQQFRRGGFRIGEQLEV
jgi:hypothetical protein